MTTNRTTDDLLHIFRDGQLAKAVTSENFRDMIVSLHAETGLFADLPGSPGSLSAGRLWQSDGIVKMSSGSGAVAPNAAFVTNGVGRFTATPRQRMIGSTQYRGAGSFSANATVAGGGPPAVFSDDFNTFNQANWAVDSYDEGGDAFWSNDPADIADVFTTSGGKLHFAIINRGSGGKSLTSGVIDTYNSQYNPGGSAHGSRYGYWEVAVAVDRYPGFEWEIDVISLPSFEAYMGLVRVWTDASNVQHVAHFTYDTPILIETDSDSGWDARQNHTYGLELTPTALRWYRDRVLVGDYGNPGGAYTNTESRYAKQWCNTNFAAYPPVSLDPAGLPKYAHLDSFRIWSSRPF